MRIVGMLKRHLKKDNQGNFNWRLSKAKIENDRRFMDIVFCENALRRQGI